MMSNIFEADIPDVKEMVKEIQKKAFKVLLDKGLISDYHDMDIDVEMWRQIWPNTSAGCSKKSSYMAGNAMTPGYVTHFTIYFRNFCEADIPKVHVLVYGTSTDDGILGIEGELEDVFFEDIRRHQVKELWQALKEY